MNSITINSSFEIPINYTGHIKYVNGYQAWYKNGLIHRDDGPAVIWADGTQFWYRYGECHREDGPAVVGTGSEPRWWLNGKHYSKDNYYRELHRCGKITGGELFIELL